VRVALLLIQGFFWILTFWLISPWLGGRFELDNFNDTDTGIFVAYSTVLNILLIYGYAHLVLPRFLKRNHPRELVFVNMLIFVCWTLGEGFIDYLFMDYAYAQNPTYDPALKNDYFKWIQADFVFNILALVAANIHGFAYEWFAEKRLRRELEQEKLIAELSALKHQINPHFLFNILNSLYGLALKNDDDETAEGITQLSQMMRYMLYESNEDRVALSKEISYLENYIDLQRLRINQQTQIHFSLDGTSDPYVIAPMILMPFVENAFKHGISVVNPSEIFIVLQVADHMLHFMVRNPIHPNPAKSKHDVGGIGLKNVIKRLDLLYGKRHEWKINTSEGFYEVNLHIPLGSLRTEKPANISSASKIV